MHVAAGRAVSEAGIADVADSVALEHIISDGGRIFLVMRVARLGIIRMLDDDIVAIAAVPAAGLYFSHQTLGRRVNRRAASVRDVYGIIIMEPTPIPARRRQGIIAWEIR